MTTRPRIAPVMPYEMDHENMLIRALKDRGYSENFWHGWWLSRCGRALVQLTAPGLMVYKLTGAGTYLCQFDATIIDAAAVDITLQLVDSITR